MTKDELDELPDSLHEWPDELSEETLEATQCQTEHCRARRRKRIKGDRWTPDQMIYPYCGDKDGDYSAFIHKNRLDRALLKEAAS